MKLLTLWRKDPDWDLPELHLAVDGWANDENPDYWLEENDKARRDHPESEFRIIHIGISDQVVEDVFNASVVVGKAEAAEEEERP